MRYICVPLQIKHEPRVPDLSFDAFQEGSLTLKGARRRDAEAADVPVSVVEGVAMASLDG